MIHIALLFQFSAFELLTKSVWDYLPSSLTLQYRPITHFVCGGLSGCAATLAAHPFDVLRTRFVAQGNERVSNAISRSKGH